MTPVSHGPENGSTDWKALREEALALRDFTTLTKERVDKAATVGDFEAQDSAMNELQLRIAKFSTLRERMGETACFLAKYRVVAHDSHTVSFVVPRGDSRIEILAKAQELARDTNLIVPWQLSKWARDPRFLRTRDQSEEFFIKGYVEGSGAMSREDEAAYLAGEGVRLMGAMEIPQLEDLAVAFALYYIKTEGKNLFGGGWSVGTAWSVRALSGLLRCDLSGFGCLREGEFWDDLDGHAVVATARVVIHRSAS